MIASFVLIQASTSQTSCDFKWRDAIGGLVVGMLGTVIYNKLFYGKEWKEMKEKVKETETLTTIVDEARKETGIEDFGIDQARIAIKDGIMWNQLVINELMESVKDNADDLRDTTLEFAALHNKIYPGQYEPGQGGTIRINMSKNGYGSLIWQKAQNVKTEKYLSAAASLSLMQNIKYNDACFNASRVTPEMLNRMFFAKEVNKEL
jgi:hypothetical protein